MLHTQLDGAGHLVDGGTENALDLSQFVAERRRAGRTSSGIPGHGPFDDRGHVGRKSVLAQIRDRL